MSKIMNIEDSYVFDIMKPKFKTSYENGIKKFQNNKFEIIKKQNTLIIIDKRSNPHKVYSNLKLALSIIHKNC